MSNPPISLAELLAKGEAADLEVKRAGGRDGRGALPQGLWPSYSAMANTEGGVIYLGIQEKPPGQFSVTGIEQIAKVKKALWDQLNNRQVISQNLLHEHDICELTMSGRRVLRIRIPRATRHQRPVYVGKNPIEGTYIRRYELVSAKLLETSGNKRGTVYFLTGAQLPTPEEVFSAPGISAEGTGVNVGGTGVNAEGTGVNVGGTGIGSEAPGVHGLVVGQNLITGLEQLPREVAKRLRQIAQPAADTERLARNKMEVIILDLCSECFLSIKVLSQLLNRTVDRLQRGYLKPMAKEKRLVMAFPQTPNHPDQAYRATKTKI